MDDFLKGFKRDLFQTICICMFFGIEPEELDELEQVDLDLLYKTTK